MASPFASSRGIKVIAEDQAMEKVVRGRQFRTLNANIKRIAIQPARHLVPDPAQPCHNNAGAQLVASLAPNPRTLHLLWEE
jgi:hypothetical protein